jgi:hypothetical protein
MIMENKYIKMKKITEIKKRLKIVFNVVIYIIVSVFFSAITFALTVFFVLSMFIFIPLDIITIPLVFIIWILCGKKCIFFFTINTTRLYSNILNKQEFSFDKID